MQCLRREKVVRVFKLNTGQDDHAIMFLDDYLNQVGISERVFQIAVVFCIANQHIPNQG